MTLPRSTMATASQVRSTSSSRCDDSTTVRPSATRDRIMSRMSSMPAGSRPFIGSSRISSSGSPRRQAATPRRWRMPMEYFDTLSSARCRMPTRSSEGSMRPLAAGSRAAARICRFWRPVRWPWKRGSSTMAPTRARARSRCRGTSWPSRDMVPASAWVSPSSTRISVVLPAPFGPRYPKAQPRGTRSSTSFTATLSPNRLVSPWVSTAHWLSPAGAGGEFASVAVLIP